MKSFRAQLSVVLIVLFVCEAIGQCPRTGVLGPNYPGKLFQYPSTRAADMMWSKRVWRTMDLREKKNHAYYYPFECVDGRMNLAMTLSFAAIEGRLTAYSSLDDEFTTPLTREDVRSMLYVTEEITYENEDGEYVTKSITSEPDYSLIKRFRIKEDWFFDRQRSVLDVRIIGLCPVAESFDDEGNYRGEKPLFWVYFLEARSALSEVKVFNRHNDAQMWTYDMMFAKRFFSSHIYKENNVYNRRISEYKQGLDALLEAKEIKDKMFNYEQDLWEY